MRGATSPFTPHKVDPQARPGPRYVLLLVLIAAGYHGKGSKQTPSETMVKVASAAQRQVDEALKKLLRAWISVLSSLIARFDQFCNILPTRKRQPYLLPPPMPIDPPLFPDLANIRSSTISLSFSGCSWLLPYHLGVVCYFKSTFPHHKFQAAAASSGCLAALALVGEVDFDALVEYVYSMHGPYSSPLSPAGRMSKIVGSGLQSLLPLDTWDVVSNRLHISSSELVSLLPPTIKNRTTSAFTSQKDLIEAVLSSCYIPIYYETPCDYFDGGLSENQPLVPKDEGNTITVSPAGGGMISPAEPLPRWMSIIPGDKGNAEELLKRGMDDAREFLAENRREGHRKGYVYSPGRKSKSNRKTNASNGNSPAR